MNMLKNKNFLLISLVIFLFSINFISFTFFIKSYKDLENTQNNKDLYAIIDKINSQQKTISAMTKDYAYWDDTYEFIENENFEYIHNNFRQADEFLTNLGFSFIIFINNKNKIVFSVFTNKMNEQTKKELLSKIKTRNINTTSEKLITINKNSFLTSSSEIKKSDSTGKSNGILFAGSEIDIASINKLFNKSIKISNELFEGKKRIDLSNDNLTNIYADLKFTSEQVRNHIHFLNSKEENILTLSYYNNRAIYKEGKRQIIIFNVIITIMSILMYIIFLKFISYQDNINKELQKRVEIELKKQREQEQILIQQSKLASMGEMIANIAHQWRQPLNALGMLIQNLNFSHQIGELDEELMKKSQEKANFLINKMSTTIDDFRDFFKPAKEKKLFDANNPVIHSIQMMQTAMNNLNIELIVKTEKNRLPIFSFENELSQVIIILLSNAKDALESDKIENPKIIIKSSSDKENVYISIKDNANGIKEDILKKIFDPYFTTKLENNGTGIGLYMAKTIIEKNMDGKLSVNTSSKGSEFIIKLIKD